MQTSEPESGDPADERERHGHHHEHRVTKLIESRIQHPGYREQQGGYDDRQPARSGGLVLELPAIRDVVAGWKCHPLTDHVFNVRREPAEVTPANVALHDHVALPALVVDDLGPLDRADPRDL